MDSNVSIHSGTPTSLEQSGFDDNLLRTQTTSMGRLTTPDRDESTNLQCVCSDFPSLHQDLCNTKISPGMLHLYPRIVTRTGGNSVNHDVIDLCAISQMRLDVGMASFTFPVDPSTLKDSLSSFPSLERSTMKNLVMSQG